MPIKGQSPKQVVHTELHKFKHGQLHSGSKKGPVVKNRDQAIAIALSESGQSKYDRSSHHKGNPGFNRSAKVSSPPKELPPHTKAFASGNVGNVPANSHDQRTKVHFSPGGNAIACPPMHNPHVFCGTNKSGVLRVSGKSGAHQVGKRSK